ncbi:zonadhesin-like [Bolinopsis microptera]|uniref:zonadhesin-like n=1 Tax=Bolinopsis microptera TaxID=2820187 RepID=UPI00307AA204
MFPAVICVLVHLVAASPSVEPYPVSKSNLSTAASLPSITTKITTSGKGEQSMPPSETMSTETMTYMSTTSPPIWTTPSYPDVPTDGTTDKTDEPTTPERGSEEVTESPVTATEPSNVTEEKEEEEEQGPSAAQTIRLSELLLRLLAVFIIVPVLQ